MSSITVTESSTGAKGLEVGTPNTTWATIRSAATAGSVATADAVDNPKASLNVSNYEINRYFLAFDTSALGSPATITAVTLNLSTDATGVGSNADSTTLEVVSATQADPPTTLTTSNFSSLSFTSGGNINLSSISPSSAFTITFNATGLTFINKTGFTKLALIIGRDQSNTAPTGLNSVNINTVDNATPSLRPTLTVTYTLPGAGGAFLLTFI